MNNLIHGLRLAIILILTSLLMACSAGPGDTAEKFMTHLAHAEYSEAKQYASQSTGELVEMMGKMGEAMGAAMGSDMKQQEDFKFILEDESIDGDKATVTFRDKEQGPVQTVHLIKVDGNWKVHEEKK